MSPYHAGGGSENLAAAFEGIGLAEPAGDSAPTCDGCAGNREECKLKHGGAPLPLAILVRTKRAGQHDFSGYKDRARATCGSYGRREHHTGHAGVKISAMRDLERRPDRGRNTQFEQRRQVVAIDERPEYIRKARIEHPEDAPFRSELLQQAPERDPSAERREPEQESKPHFLAQEQPARGEEQAQHRGPVQEGAHGGVARDRCSRDQLRGAPRRREGKRKRPSDWKGPACVQREEK